jgi:hypothetical protein
MVFALAHCQSQAIGGYSSNGRFAWRWLLRSSLLALE